MHVHKPADGPCGNCGPTAEGCPMVYCPHCPVETCKAMQAVLNPDAPAPARPKPALGRHVHVLVDPRLNNGSDVATAVIVRVWPSGTDEHDTVNLRVLLDGTNTTHEWAPSRLLYGTEAQARERLLLMPGPINDAAYVTGVAFWPEGVR